MRFDTTGQNALVIKTIRKMSSADKAAHALVLAYVQRYAQNRGLVARFPRLVNSALMGKGCVYNVDGDGTISQFSTPELARWSIVAAEQNARATGLTYEDR